MKYYTFTLEILTMLDSDNHLQVKFTTPTKPRPATIQPPAMVKA